MKNQRQALGLIVWTITVLTAPYVLAAETSGEAAKAGLPQLDVRLFPGQIFWLALTFVVLYVLMASVALPSVKRTLGARQDVLTADLTAAEAANEATKSMMAQYEKALTDARAKAQITVSAMTEAAQKAAAVQKAAQQRELSQRLAEAETKIMQTRDEAIRNLGSMALELSSTIVEKVTGTKIRAGGQG